MAKLLTKSVLGFGLVLLLAGCLGNNPKTVEISARPVPRPTLTLPPVDELNLRPIEWVVINAENMDEKLAELTANGQPLAIFVLTSDGYENLALNLSDIRAMIQQQQQIILAYERYYRESEEALSEANSRIQ